MKCNFCKVAATKIVRLTESKMQSFGKWRHTIRQDVPWCGACERMAQAHKACGMVEGTDFDIIDLPQGAK